MNRAVTIGLILLAVVAGSVGATDGTIPADELHSASEHGATPTSFLGELHPAVVHFPIAWLSLLFLVELVNLFRRRSGLHRLAGYLLFLTVLSFIPAVVTGWLQSTHETFGGELAAVFDLHRNLNLAVTALLFGALFFRPQERGESIDIKEVVYGLIVLAATGLVLYSGHLGGRLVHG